jgi:hypothetical protein
MAIVDFQNCIFNLFNSQLLLLSPSIPLIWEHQNAPRPQLPYVSLGIISIQRLGQQFTESTDQETTINIVCLYSITVRLSCFHSKDGGNHEAISVLDYLRLCLSKESVVNYRETQGVSLLNSNGLISFLPKNIATGFEPRAFLEVVFGFRAAITDESISITTIQGKGNINKENEELEINYNSTIEA